MIDPALESIVVCGPPPVRRVLLLGKWSTPDTSHPLVDALDPSISSHAPPSPLPLNQHNPPHTDGENEAARSTSSNGNGAMQGLDLTKLFTPPSTKAPFGGIAQQLSSFFDKLLNPDAAASKKDGSPQPQQKGQRPKRRTGGPVSVVFGATGRTGREVVTALLAAGHDVVAVSRVYRLSACGWEKEGSVDTQRVACVCM
jgi:hypothetical protein